MMVSILLIMNDSCNWGSAVMTVLVIVVVGLVPVVICDFLLIVIKGGGDNGRCYGDSGGGSEC